MNANARIASGDNAPDDDLVDGPIGMRYFQNGTTIVWVKYGAQKYNWRPFELDVRDGFLYNRQGADNEQAILDTVGVAGTGAGASSTAEAGRAGINTGTVTAVATPDRVRYDNIKGTPIMVGGGKLYMFTSLKMSAVPDGVDNFSVRTLMQDIAASADAVNGIYFESDRQVYGDNNWRGKTANGGVRSVVDLGAATVPASGVYQRLGIVVNAPGTLVTFMVDDIIRGTLAANIPAGGTAVGSGQVIKTLGAAARSVGFDYVYCAMLCAAGR